MTKKNKLLRVKLLCMCQRVTNENQSIHIGTFAVVHIWRTLFYSNTYLQRHTKNGFKQDNTIYIIDYCTMEIGCHLRIRLANGNCDDRRM